MSEENISADSTNNSNKEKDKINYINENIIDFNYNFYDKSQIEKEEFQEPDHEFNWIYSDNSTYHFKQDIERIWMIIRNFEILSLINNKVHYPIIPIKGKDSWKVGNIFKGNLSGKYPFVAKVVKCINFPEFKKIDWILHFKKDNYIFFRFEFFKVTDTNSTVLLKTVKFEKLELKQEIYEFLKNKDHKIFSKIEKILEKEAINLLKYESAIISGKMEDIWNFILDFNKFIVIAPNNNFLPNIDIRELKIGEKKEVSVFFDNKKKYFDLTLKYREERPEWNKWQIVAEASGGHPIKVPRHTFLFQLTKINKMECQLTLLTKYHEPINNEKFKKLSNLKKYLLVSLKDFFENFYTPSTSK